jgi:hypothetical protein
MESKPSGYEKVEIDLSGIHANCQTGLCASPHHREGWQTEAAADGSEQTRSRTAGPDLQPVKVSGKIVCHVHESFAQPGRNEICLGRHRPANTFPPVFTGLSDFFPDRVGFYPIYESMKLADVGENCGRHQKSKHDAKSGIPT